MKNNIFLTKFIILLIICLILIKSQKDISEDKDLKDNIAQNNNLSDINILDSKDEANKIYDNISFDETNEDTSISNTSTDTSTNDNEINTEQQSLDSLIDIQESSDTSIINSSDIDNSEKDNVPDKVISDIELDENSESDIECHPTCKTCIDNRENSCSSCDQNSDNKYLLKNYNYYNSALINSNVGKCVDSCSKKNSLLNKENNECYYCEEHNCNNFNSYDDITFNVKINKEIKDKPLEQYSLGIWSFFEPGFSSNFKFIFKDHASLMINQVYRRQIQISCFPQEYRTNIDNNTDTFIEQILDSGSSFYNNGYNYEIGNEETWKFYFCSVDLNIGEFYINNSPIFKVYPNSFGNYYKDMYYRQPKEDTYKAILKDISKGKNRLYIRQLLIFGSYFPQEIYNKLAFYKDFSTALGKYKKLLLYANFPIILENDKKQNNDKNLNYDKSNNKESLDNIDNNNIEKQLDNDDNNLNDEILFKYYNLSGENTILVNKVKDTKNNYAYASKVYDLNLCKLNQIVNNSTVSKYSAFPDFECEDIENCSEDSYCLDSDSTYLKCDEGSFMNMSSFECLNNDFYNMTTYPNGENYVNLDCNEYNIKDCPEPGYKESSEFKCNESSYKFFYECIPARNYMGTTAPYFTSNYGFANTNIDYSILNLEEYTIELWIKIDTTFKGHHIFNPLYLSSNKYVYMYATPNILYVEDFKWKLINGDIDENSSNNSNSEENNKESINNNKNKLDNSVDNENLSKKEDNNSKEGLLLKNKVYNFETHSDVNIDEWIGMYFSVSKLSNGKISTRIYINYNPIPILDIQSNKNKPLTSFIMCPFINTNGECVDDFNTIYQWGFNWYKDLRIWNNKYWIHPRFYQDHVNSYRKDSKEILFSHFDFRLRNIEYNEVENNIIYRDLVKNNNYDIKVEFDNSYIHQMLKHKTKIINYSISFDRYYYGKFAKNGTYLNLCPENCSRCYTETNCYDCMSGYTLYVDKCLKTQRYYLRMPPKDFKEIELKTSKLDLEYNFNEDSESDYYDNGFIGGYGYGNTKYNNNSERNKNRYTSLDKLDRFSLIFSMNILSNSPSADNSINEHDIILLSNDRQNRLTLFIDDSFSEDNNNNNNDIDKNNKKLINTSEVNNSNYIVQNSKSKLILYLNNKKAVVLDYDMYLGKWIHLGISIQRSNDTKIYPHMLHVQFNNQILQHHSEFDIKEELIILDTIILNHEVYAMYHEIRFYNSYIIGSIGVIRNSSLYNLFLLKKYDFSDSYSSSYCINLIKDTTNKSGLKQYDVVCSGDSFNSLLSTDSFCPSYKTFLDFDKYVSLDKYSCEKCNNKCILEFPDLPEFKYTDERRVVPSSCYNKKEDKCSCFINKYSYYILDNTCRPMDSLNFALLNNFNLPVKTSINNEMTIEFWTFVYTYQINSFKSVEIAWDGHMRIVIEGSGNGNLLSKCYPYYEHNKFEFLGKTSNNVNNLNFIIDKNTKNSFKEREWKYIRCSIDKRISREKYYINDSNYTNIYNFDHERAKSYIEANKNDKENTKDIYDYVNLYIEDKNSDPNYGVFFIREFKLFSAFFFHQYSTQFKRLSREEYNKDNNLQFLLHYFTFKNTLFDRVNSDSTSKNMRIPIIDVSESNRYIEKQKINYVSAKDNKELKGYSNFDMDLSFNVIICNENEFLKIDNKNIPFNHPNNICVKDSDPNVVVNCQITSSPFQCLLCSKEEPYLHSSDKCYKNCPKGFYGNNYLKMCRECHTSCNSCNGENIDNCLSCVEPFYLYKYKDDKKYDSNSNINGYNTNNIKGLCAKDCSEYNKINYVYKNSNIDIFEKYNYTTDDEYKPGDYLNAECATPKLNIELINSNIIENKRYAIKELNYLEAKVKVFQQLYSSNNKKLIIKENSNNPEDELNYIDEISEYQTTWIFDKEETILQNKNILSIYLGINKEDIPNYFNDKDNIKSLISMFLNDNVFSSSVLNTAKVELVNNVFIPGFTYVFALEIKAQSKTYPNLSFSKEYKLEPKNFDIFNSKRIIVKTAEYPNEGKIEILPVIGIGEVTDFSISCNNWNSHVDIDKNLKYQITSRYIDSDVFLDQSTQLLVKPVDLLNYELEVNSDKAKRINKYNYNEVIIQDYNSNNSILVNFALNKEAQKTSKYEIICRVKDNKHQISGQKFVVNVYKYTKINFENQIKLLFKKNFTVNELNMLDENTEYIEMGVYDKNKSKDIAYMISSILGPLNYNRSNSINEDNLYNVKELESIDDNKLNYDKLVIDKLKIDNDKLIEDEVNSQSIKKEDTNKLKDTTLFDNSNEKCNRLFCNNNGVCKHITSSIGRPYLICKCNKDFYGYNCQLTLISYKLITKLINDIFKSKLSNIPSTNYSKSILSDKELNNIIDSMVEITNSYSLYKLDYESIKDIINKSLKVFVDYYILQSPNTLYKRLDSFMVIIENLKILVYNYNELQFTSISFNNNMIINNNNNKENINNNNKFLKDLIELIKNYLVKIVSSVVKYKHLSNINDDVFSYNIKLNNNKRTTIYNNNTSRYYKIINSSINKLDLRDRTNIYENLHVNILELNYLANNFNKFTQDFSYLNIPFLKLNNCLKSDIKNIVALIVYYNNSPYSLLFNSNSNSKNKNFNLPFTSSLLSVDLIDKTTGYIVNIDNCNGDNIELLFPLNLKYIPNLDKSWTKYLNPEFSKNILNDNYFVEPLYISPNGKVHDLLLKDRVLKSFSPLNFSCSYIKKDTFELSNKGIVNYDNNIVDYTNINNSLYYKCSTSHLTDFHLNYDLQEISINSLTKFYYLDRFYIYNWSDNYKNCSFILFILLLAFLFILLIIHMSKIIHLFYYVINNKNNNKQSQLKKIKLAIIKSLIPYLKEYKYNEIEDNTIYNNVKHDSIKNHDDLNKNANIDKIQDNHNNISFGFNSNKSIDDNINNNNLIIHKKSNNNGIQNTNNDVNLITNPNNINTESNALNKDLSKKDTFMNKLNNKIKRNIYDLDNNLNNGEVESKKSAIKSFSRSNTSNLKKESSKNLLYLSEPKLENGLTNLNEDINDDEEKKQLSPSNNNKKQRNIISANSKHSKNSNLESVDEVIINKELDFDNNINYKAKIHNNNGSNNGSNNNMLILRNNMSKNNDNFMIGKKTREFKVYNSNSKRNSDNIDKSLNYVTIRNNNLFSSDDLPSIRKNSANNSIKENLDSKNEPCIDNDKYTYKNTKINKLTESNNNLDLNVRNKKSMLTARSLHSTTFINHLKLPNIDNKESLFSKIEELQLFGEISKEKFFNINVLKKLYYYNIFNNTCLFKESLLLKFKLKFILKYTFFLLVILCIELSRLSIIMFIVSLLLTSTSLSPLATLSETIGYAIGFAIIASFLCIIYIKIAYYFISINNNELRKLYAYIKNRNDKDLKNNIYKLNKINISHILILAISLIIILFGFHFSFGFCAVYKTQQYAWLISVLIALLLYTIIMIFIEILCMYMYKNKEIIKCVKILAILDVINSNIL